MAIDPGLAAELDLLTQAIDRPGTDVAETLTRLADDARTAVDSYLGLRVAIGADPSPIDLTVLEAGTQPKAIRTSVLIPLSIAAAGSTTPATVALILYAATAGAFVDLAADLSWITGRPLTDFRLDEHRALPVRYADPTVLGAMSTINQALGVLIGRGSSPAQAERDLYQRAVAADTDQLTAATLILADLPGPTDGPTPRPVQERSAHREQHQAAEPGDDAVDPERS